MLDLQQLRDLLEPRYQLQRELGGGAMATVFLAEDTRHHRQVAIKVLSREYAAPLTAERFLREIEIAARLQHPHIVPLLDSGEAGDHLYLVMPFIEGESLRARLARESRLPVGDVIRIMSDVADALAYAHAKGIVHRDIKPDNILLAGRHGLVTDFGVAKAVSAATLEPRELTAGVVIGTPYYMAPEQVTGDSGLDQRVDLYSLGVVAYELLIGVPPFEGPNAQAVLAAHVLDPVPPIETRRAGVPPALAAIIERCLAKRAEDRWQTAEALLQQLEPLATPSGGSTPAGVVPVNRQPSPLWLGLALLGLVALTIAGFLTRPRSGGGPAFAEQQVTFSGEILSSAVSPDGQLLAFVSESADGSHLMVQELKGGKAIQLATGKRMGQVSWSADGSDVRSYLFDNVATFIQVVPRLGGRARLIQVAPWCALSPDGRRLFALPQGGRFTRILDLTSGDSVEAPLEPTFWYGPPAWSADGRWIAATGMSQSGAEARLLVFSAGDLSQQVVVRDSVPLSVPAWDGGTMALYYLRGTGGLLDLYRVRLGRKGTAASPPQLVRAGLSTGVPDPYISFASSVSVSADGSLLTYTERHDWSNLGLIDFGAWKTGAGPRLLTTGSATYETARFSPDGRSLAAVRTFTDAAALEILSASGGTTQELGRFGEGLGLSWSPDGQRIMAGIIERDSGIGVRTFSLADHSSQTRFNGLVGATPEWLNDSLIVAPQLGNRSLQLLEPGTGRHYPVPGLDTNGWMLWPRRSPDGRAVVFAWNQGRNQQSLQLYRLSDSTSHRLLPAILNPMGFSADGRTVFAVTARSLVDSNKVFAIPVNGEPVRVLALFPPALEVVDVSADGRTALLNIRKHRSDAWAMRFSSRPR